MRDEKARVTAELEKRFPGEFFSLHADERFNTNIPSDYMIAVHLAGGGLEYGTSTKSWTDALKNLLNPPKVSKPTEPHDPEKGPPDLEGCGVLDHEKALRLWGEWRDSDILDLIERPDGLLTFIVRNRYRLHQRWTFEKCFIKAYLKCKANPGKWDYFQLLEFVTGAEKERLQACTDPLPERKTLTLYRGVAGKGGTRRVRGFSWTSDPGHAAWFARQKDGQDPAVFSVTVDRNKVIARIGSHSEDEYLLDPYELPRPKRLITLPEPKRPALAANA